MARQEQMSGVLGLNANLDKKTNPYLSTDDMWEVQGFYPKEALSLTKRKGFAAYNLTQLKTSGNLPETFTGLFEYVPSVGSRHQIATSSTLVSPGVYEGRVFRYGTPVAYEWNVVSLTNVTTSPLVGTVDQLFDSATLEDQMYLGNGIDANMRWDGLHPTTAALYNMGIVAPVAADSVPDTFTATATVGGGSLSTGVYKYLVTYGNRMVQESNAGPVVLATFEFAPATATAAAGGHIDLTHIPVSPDAQVTERHVYRTTADGAIYLYCGTISDNITEIYADTKADADLAEEVELFANGVPPKFSMIEIYRGVAFMIAPNSSRVWFSMAGYPCYVDSNDFRDLDPNDGDIITGIHKFQNTVIVTKNNSVWVLTGEDRFTFGFDKRVTSAGSISNTSIVEIPTKNMVIMLSNHPRFFLFDGSIAAPTAPQMEPTLRGLNQSLLSKTVGTVVSSQNQIRWIVPDTNKSQCTTMIWYDYVLDKWGTVALSNTAANFCTTMRDTTNTIQFYLAEAYDPVLATGGGYVVVGDTGGTDVGVDISCQVTDRGHPREDTSPENQKCFYHLFLWYSYTGVLPAPVLDVYGIKDTVSETPILIGQITCDNVSGQEHLHMNMICRRLYVQVRESTSIEGLVIRGWKLYYKDLGRHHAP